MGNQALAVLDRPGVQSSSRGMAVAGKIVGIIGIVLGVLWLIAVVAMLALGMLGAATGGGGPTP
jgi:hypothetical protein